MPDDKAKAGGRENDDADYEMDFVPIEEGEEPDARQPATGALGGQENVVPRLVAFDPTKRYKGRLFSLKNNSTKRNNPANFAGATGRSFNYEEMYDQDPYGEEAFPDARVWKVYNDEAQLFDLERIEAWRDAIDVQLVFIGLFAAVVSAFLIETSKSLQPDYAQITAITTFAILRSLNTSVLPHPTFSADLLGPHFGSATKDNSLVSTLWYASLTISLSIALLAMLIKQWLHQFMTSTSGTARERARIRHFRFVGLDKYRVPVIIDLLPTLLHLALGLFLIGLAIYLKPLDNIMFAFVVGIAAIPYMFYFISITIPFFDAQCPYKSPPSFYIYPLQRYIVTALQPLLLRIQMWWLATLVPAQHLSGALRQYSRQMTQRLWSVTQSILYWMTRTLSQARRFLCLPAAQQMAKSAESVHVDTAGTQASSLSEAEKHAVSKKGHQLDVDGIVYLCQTSANTNVLNIALEAFGGLPPSNANVESVDHIIDSDLHTMIRACCDIELDAENFARLGMEQRHDRLIRALCIRLDVDISEPYDLDIQDPNPGERDPRIIFGHFLFPWFERGWGGSDFAALFAFASCQTFPLPVWATLIRLATRHRPEDPVIRVILLSTLHLPLDPSEVGAVTFGRAMQNSFVRSIGLAYLGISNADKEGTLPIYLSSITYLLSEEYMPHLEKTAHDFQRFSPSNHPSTSPIPHLLSSILPPLFQSLGSQIKDTTLLEESEVILSAILTNFFTSSHLNDLSWETFASAIRMWTSPFPLSTRAITTSSMIRIALKELCHRNNPKEEDVERVRDACRYLASVFYWCLDATGSGLYETVYSGIRELDMLPLDVESQAKTSIIHLFWHERMCQHIVHSTYQYSEAQSRDEWLSYIYAPARLTFLCSRFVGYNPDSLPKFCWIQPQNPSWPTVFKNLLSLFDNQVYLNSLEDVWHRRIQQPRRHLSGCLVEMKNILVEHHSILSQPEYDIPQFDDKDYPIASASAINPTNPARRLQQLLSAESTSNIGHPSDSHEPSATMIDPLLQASSSSSVPLQAPPDDVCLTHTTMSTEPFPNATMSGPFDATSPTSLGIDPPAEVTSATSLTDYVSGPSESPLDNPNHPPPSDATQHLSLDMGDASSGVAQAEDPAPRHSFNLERQSVESKAERGDSDE